MTAGLVYPGERFAMIPARWLSSPEALRLSPIAFRVWMLLFGYASHGERAAWPTWTTLRRATNCSRASVARALAQLEVEGLLVKRRHPGSSPTYYLQPPPTCTDGGLTGETQGGLTGETGGSQHCDRGGLTGETHNRRMEQNMEQTPPSGAPGSQECDPPDLVPECVARWRERLCDACVGEVGELLHGCESDDRRRQLLGEVIEGQVKGMRFAGREKGGVSVARAIAQEVLDAQPGPRPHRNTRARQVAKLSRSLVDAVDGLALVNLVHEVLDALR